MPDTVGEAFVAVRPETTGFGPELEAGLGGTLTKFAGVMAGIFAASKVKDFFSTSISEGYESIKVGKQTEAVLRSTGGAANLTSSQINDLANSLSKKAGIDDEVIQSGENLLLTFRSVRNEAGKGNDVFTQATKAALDMSVAMGQDLNSSVLQLGKALNDPISGMTALRRVGVQFTQEQQDQIKTLVEHNDLLGAQKVILNEVTQEFGGSAAAQATAADKARVSFKNMQESIGIALIPAVETAATAISFLTDEFNSLPAPVRTALVDVTVFGGGALAAAAAVGKLAPLVKDGAAQLTDMSKGFVAAAGSATPWIVGLGLAAGAAYALYRGLNDTGSQIDVDIQKLAALKGQGLDKATAGLLTIGKVTGDTAATQKAFSQILEKAPQLAQPFIDSLQRQGANTAGFKAQLAKAADEAVRAQAAQSAWQNKVNGLTLQSATGELTSYRDALASGADQTQAFANLTDQAKTAIDNLQSALLTAAGGQLGYQQALINQTKAEQSYNDAVAQYGPTSQQAAEALLALKQAKLQTASATAALDDNEQKLLDSVGGTTEGIDAEIERMKTWQKEHPEAADSINPLIYQLLQLKAKVESVPKDNKITFTVDTGTAIGNVDALLGKLQSVANLPGISALIGITAANQAALSGTRASGGPVGPGTYLVGEQGPELLTLGSGSSGQVTNAADTAKMLGGSGLFAGATVNIGTESVVPDLDYWAATRMAGV